ncbi:MAG: hypothetical protein KDD51_09030 [Bdellovibrionales bacterium]|nr:hypothetical protein [Bdellovibrionales bacterium]
MKLIIILTAFVSLSLFACDNHPGMTHDQYVVSIRKRYETPVAADTYSTAIVDEAPQAEPPAQGEQPSESTASEN